MLFVACNLFLTFSVPAQKTPMKWGKLSIEEIELNSYSSDTSASAVVLCDYGEIYFMPGQPIEVRRHKRVKILKK